MVDGLDRNADATADVHRLDPARSDQLVHGGSTNGEHMRDIEDRQQAPRRDATRIGTGVSASGRWSCTRATPGIGAPTARGMASVDVGVNLAAERLYVLTLGERLRPPASEGVPLDVPRGPAGRRAPRGVRHSRRVGIGVRESARALQPQWSANRASRRLPEGALMGSDLGFCGERVTRIELAFSAWEAALRGSAEVR